MTDDLSDLFDPFAGAEPRFPVHVLTVESVEDLDGLVDTDVYTIDHGLCVLRGEECIVEGTISELGLRASLNGVWSKEPVELRTYRVRGWVQKYDVPGTPIEYDAGIEEVDDED